TTRATRPQAPRVPTRLRPARPAIDAAPENPRQIGRTFPVLRSARMRLRGIASRTVETAGAAGERASVRVFSGRPAVKWPPRPFKSDMGSGEAICQDIVREDDHLDSTRVDIAMHVANQMTDAGGLSQITWVDDEDLFIRRADHVRGFSVVMQQLPGMKNRAG